MADNLIQNYLINQNTPAATLKVMLDAQAARQRAHTQNIANAETPGYQRVRVEFEELLQDRLNHREGRERGRIRAQHARSQPRRSNKGQGTQPVKLGRRLAP